MDPRPPYVEDKGKRSRISGCLATLVVPLFIVYVLLNFGSSYRPIHVLCLCSTEKGPTENNGWLFNPKGVILDKWTPNDAPTITYVEMKVTTFYMKNVGSWTATTPSCTWAYYPNGINTSCLALGMAYTGGMQQPAQLTNVTWKDIAIRDSWITCPGQTTTSPCSKECEQLSTEVHEAIWSVQGDVLCPTTNAKFCAIEGSAENVPSLCTTPSLASTLGILGAGFGLVMGLFVNAPAGMRLVFNRLVTQSNDAIGSSRDIGRALIRFFVGLGYFGWLFTEFRGKYSRIDRYLVRIGIVWLCVLLFQLFFTLIATTSSKQLAIVIVVGLLLSVGMVAYASHSFCSILPIDDIGFKQHCLIHMLSLVFAPLVMIIGPFLWLFGRRKCGDEMKLEPLIDSASRPVHKMVMIGRMMTFDGAANTVILAMELIMLPWFTLSVRSNVTVEYIATSVVIIVLLCASFTTHIYYVMPIVKHIYKCVSAYDCKAIAARIFTCLMSIAATLSLQALFWGNIRLATLPNDVISQAIYALFALVVTNIAIVLAGAFGLNATSTIAYFMHGAISLLSLIVLIPAAYGQWMSGQLWVPYWIYVLIHMILAASFLAMRQVRRQSSVE